jgi:NAD(P)H-nitrite reductase large subunit
LEKEEILTAIENLHDFTEPNSNKKLDDEVIICECFCVNVADIRRIQKNEVNIESLKKSFGLGNGCSSCLKTTHKWKNKIF